MLIDWMLMLALFLGFGFSLVRAENRAKSGTISRSRSMLELSVGNALLAVLIYLFSILFRKLGAIPLDEVINAKFISIVGFGLLCAHIWVSLKLWKKLGKLGSS